MAKFVIILIQNFRMLLAITIFSLLTLLVFTLVRPINELLSRKLSKYSKTTKVNVSNPIFLQLLIIFLVWGTLLRIVNLGFLEFYGDEFRHVLSAQGYNQSGKFVYWDQIYNKPSDYIYKRASLYTWQVAQSIKLLGISETAARLPSVIWGTLFLIVALLIARKIEKSNLLALVFLSQLIFDPTLVWQTRTVRMYTMFYTLFFLMIYLILRFIQRKVLINRIALGILVLIIFLLTFKTHELTVLLIPTILFYSLYRVQYLKESFSKKKRLILVTVVSAAIIGLLGLKIFSKNIEFSQPNIEYAFLSIKFFAQPLIALILVGVGIVYVLTQKESTEKNQNILLLILFISYLGLLIFATNRYNNLRYLFPATVTVYWFFSQGVVFVINKISTIWRLSTKVSLLVAFLIILLLGNKISIPNLTKNTPITALAVSNSLPDPGLGYTNEYKKVYNLLQANDAQARIFALQGPHQLWYAKGLSIITLPEVISSLPNNSKQFFKDENTSTAKVKEELDSRQDFANVLYSYLISNEIKWLIIEKNLAPNWINKITDNSYELVNLRLSNLIHDDGNLLIFKKLQ